MTKERKVKVIFLLKGVFHMKKTRKIIACISALCMVFSTSAISVSAESISPENFVESDGTFKYKTDKCGDNVTWSFDAETGTLTLSGTGNTYDYYIKGISIQLPWEEYIDDITSVVIGEGITSIGANMFTNSKALKSVKLPESLESIGSCAFLRCSIENITLPPNLKTIEDSAFSDNNIKEIVIPEGVTDIGYMVFGRCEELVSAVIPSTLKSGQFFGESLFYECKSLKDVTIADGLESLGSSTFNGCTSLTEITIPESVKVIGLSAFKNCTSLTDVKLSEGLETIRCSAFENCSSLENISIPSTVSCIGDWAFDKTPLIDNQDTAIKYVDKWAYTCPGYDNKLCEIIDIQSIEIKDDTVGIANSSFRDLENVKSVVIPASVKFIGESAFTSCNSLTDITIENPDCIFSEWSSFNNGYVTVKPENEEYITSDGTYYIDELSYTFTGTIHGYENSTAYEYSLENGFKFSAIDSDISLEANPKYDKDSHSCFTIKNDDDFNKFILESKVWDNTENNYAVMVINEVGKDKDGNRLLSHSPYLAMSGYDENGNPVIEQADCPEPAYYLGITPDGEIIYGGYMDKLVWRGDNNNIKIVDTQYVDYEKDIYKTINLNTGEDILFRKTPFGYSAVETGDANTDGNIDVRDATALKKDIVKLETLPDYAFTADVNSDGVIDIKDLGTVTKYIIKVIDKF